MSFLTAVRPSKSTEKSAGIEDLPTVEQLQAHFDLPAFDPIKKAETKLTFRDVGYAKVGARAVRGYLPQILVGRGLEEHDAHRESNLLANRIESLPGTHDHDVIRGREAADVLEALGELVVHEVPSREHPGNVETYAGSTALFMLSNMSPDQADHISLGR